MKKYDAVDWLKGILSIFIVMIHTDFLYGKLYPILRIAVPVFFIISAFFAFVKIDQANDWKEKDDRVFNITKRYMKLYFFWFIVLLPITLYSRQYFEVGFVKGSIQIVKKFFTGSTFQGSWYIMACVIGLWTVYGLSKRLGNFYLCLIGIVLYLFATICSKYSGLIYSIPNVGSVYMKFTEVFGLPYNNFIIAIPYFIIGKILAEHKDKAYNLKMCVTGAWISLILLMIEFGLVTGEDFFVKSCDCLFMLAPIAIFIVMATFSLQWRNKYSAYIRKMSTIIYCSHMSIIVILRIVLTKLGVADYYNILLFLLASVISITGSLIILKLEQNKKFKWLNYAY